MILTASPQRGLPGAIETTASIAGDVLTVNGTAYDLSAVPEGGEAIPAGDHPFIGPITREAGEVAVSILWIYGDGAVADQPTDPAYWVASLSDGPVPSPILKEAAE